jgi:hypothetical protein
MRVSAPNLGGGGSDGDHDSLFVGQFPGEESDVSAAPDDPAMSDQPSRFGRAEELDVKIRGRRELAGAERRHQRRGEGRIEHGGQKAALHPANEIQEPVRCCEGDFDGPCIWIYGNELEAQCHCRARGFGSAFDDIPKRAASRH